MGRGRQPYNKLVGADVWRCGLARVGTWRSALGGVVALLGVHYIFSSSDGWQCILHAGKPTCLRCSTAVVLRLDQLVFTTRIF